MKPRILLAMPFWDQVCASYLQTILSDAFMMVEYTGPETLGALAHHLREHNDEFDAVMVMDTASRAGVRVTVEQNYSGPKILLRSTYEYEPPEGKYRLVVDYPMIPSHFEKRVADAFADLPQVVPLDPSRLLIDTSD